MKRQNVLKILLILVVVFVGGYVYFAGSTPTPTPASAPMAEEVFTTVADQGQTLVVSGEAYGGCDRAGRCPSFTIADNGEYRYMHTPRDASAEALRTGSLPPDIERQLRQAVTADALEQMSRPIDPDMCDSYVDGIDARYRIELNGVTYELDSCSTTVEADSAAWEVLGGLWYYFELSE